MTVTVVKETDLRPLDISTLNFTAQQFERLCAANPDLALELTAEGLLIIMAPARWESSKRNMNLGSQLFNWNERTRLGEVFDSSGGFTLPNGAVRSPDVSWIEKSKFANISVEVAFPTVVPDFVIELRSKTDSLKTLQDKMLEYRSNGVRLGWLINPQQQQIEIYRSEREAGTERLALSVVEGSRSVEILQSPNTLSGEDVLSGFILDLSSIW